MMGWKKNLGVFTINKGNKVEFNEEWIAIIGENYQKISTIGVNTPLIMKYLITFLTNNIEYCTGYQPIDYGW